MLATQQLLIKGANLQPVDFVAERLEFLNGELRDVLLCLDGLPFHTLEADIENWLREHIGDDHGSRKISVVLGIDGRPSGRAVVAFGSDEKAAKALVMLDGGRILTCRNTPGERLVLA